MFWSEGAQSNFDALLCRDRLLRSFSDSQKFGLYRLVESLLKIRDAKADGAMKLRGEWLMFYFRSIASKYINLFEDDLTAVNVLTRAGLSQYLQDAIQMCQVAR